MSNLITLDKLALDDAVFRACEEATVALTSVPLRLRASFAIQASTAIMAEVDKMAVAVPAQAAPGTRPTPPRPARPPRVRAPRTAPGGVPPAPGGGAQLTPSAPASEAAQRDKAFDNPHHGHAEPPPFGVNGNT